MIMDAHNNWSDIPPEIVEEVLEYCDEPSLLVLGQVNHQLNTLALSRYFAPKIKDGILSLLIGLPIRVLHIALWLPSTIHSIFYKVEGDTGSYDQYINDLRDLTSFIHRMPKVKYLAIEYSTRSVEKHNAKAHYEVLGRLLAVATSKGCEGLLFSDDGLFIDSEAVQQLPSSPKPSGCFDVSVLRSKLELYWSRIGQVSTFRKGRERLFVRPKSTLREIGLYGSIFSGSHPVAHTLLTQHATTITYLCLRNLDIWDSANAKNSIFNYIHFPALHYFEFTVDEEAEVSPKLILKFLHRHPQVVNLILRAHLDKDQLLQLKRRPSAHPPLKFPKLRKLQIFPEVLEWLAPDFRLCPNIKSIYLEGMWPLNPSPDAIRSILNNLHASASMTSPVKITIWLPLYDTDWVSKLQNVVNSGPSPCWSRVKDLYLLEAVDLESRRTTPIPIPNVLIDWISRFPSLERLEVYPMTWEARKALGRSLAVRCPRLSSEFKFFRKYR